MQRVNYYRTRLIAPLLVLGALMLVADNATAQNANVPQVPPPVIPPNIPVIPPNIGIGGGAGLAVPAQVAPPNAVVGPAIPASPNAATMEDRLGGCPEGPPCPDDEAHAGKEKAP